MKMAAIKIEPRCHGTNKGENSELIPTAMIARLGIRSNLVHLDTGNRTRSSRMNNMKPK
jgi:hypothetical protein